MNDSMSTECLAWIQRPQYWDTGRSRVTHPLPCEADSKWGTLGTKTSKPRHLQREGREDLLEEGLPAREHFRRGGSWSCEEVNLVGVQGECWGHPGVRSGFHLCMQGLPGDN